MQEAMPQPPTPKAQLRSPAKARAGPGGAWDDGQDGRSRGKSLDPVSPSLPALPKRKCLHSVPTQTVRRPGLAVISRTMRVQRLQNGPALAWGSGGRGPGSSLTDLLCGPGHRQPWPCFSRWERQSPASGPPGPLQALKWATHLVVTTGWAAGLCPDAFSHGAP